MTSFMHLGLNFRPSAMQRARMLMFKAVPEELSFAQPHACQDFLNAPRLILAGIDGEVSLGDIQLEDAGSKVDEEVAPLHLSWAFQNCIPSAVPEPGLCWKRSKAGPPEDAPCTAWMMGTPTAGKPFGPWGAGDEGC